MLLTALTSVVLSLAQAAPDATPPPQIARVVVNTDPSSAPLTATPEVKARTISPLVVTPRQQRELQDEIAKRELICRSEPVIGSLFPKKICATKEELADRRNLDQAELRKVQAQRPYKSN